MKYTVLVIFTMVFSVLALRCSKENDKPAPTDLSPTTNPSQVGETGLIHDDSVFYETSPSGHSPYWVAAPINAPVPENFDLRGKGTPFPSPGDQSNCGSCWAYSTGQAMDIWWAINKKELLDHSKQYLLSCSGNGSCAGGYMSVVTWLVKSGLPLEASFPYVAKDIKCKFSKEEIAKGFGNQLLEAPYIGESFEKSRYWKLSGGTFEPRDKMSQIQQAMIQLNSPAVVTVAAYGANSDQVISGCSALNSGGNHMVNVIGWDNEGGGPNAHVYNSWGKGHGKDGISRIKWNCDGKLNRGLGVSARVLRGESKPPCDPPANPDLKPEQIIFMGSKAEIGKDIPNVKCVWSPTYGLKDPNSCKTDAMPEKSTEYHLEVSNECGKVTAMTFVRVFAPVLVGGGDVKYQETGSIVTPFGETKRR